MKKCFSQNISKMRKNGTIGFSKENQLSHYRIELIKGTDVFTVLLIEEPEAHLHPQLQVKFIKYLESLTSTLPNAQVIVSTHSPVLASSVKLNKLIHLCSSDY